MLADDMPPVPSPFMAPSKALGLACLLGLSFFILAGCGGGGGGGGTLTSPPPPPPPITPFQALTNQPPNAGFLTLLMTDGTVIMQSNANAGIFYKLTPDNTGNYVNGTWTRIASPPAGYAPYASAEAVLGDGRMVFVGGEYNQNQYQLPFAPTALTNMSAVYDPKLDSWTMIAPPPGVDYIGDPPSVVLPDGRFVFGTKLDNKMFALNPVSLTWAAMPAPGKQDNFAEEGFTLMPNDTIFTVDVGSQPKAEHYVLSTGQWVADNNAPFNLTSPTDYPSGLTYGPSPVQVVGGITYGPGPAGTYFPPGEVGPAILRPDGTVFATGSAKSPAIAHNAVYHMGATASAPGTWSAAPSFPAGESAGDASAVLLPSGDVLVAGVTGNFYDFDGTNLTNIGSLPTNNGNIAYFLLPLPNGQILVTGGVTQVFKPTGTPQAAWAPTITNVATPLTHGQTFTLTGTQLNGLSQGASYGDEFHSSTNYPIVRITNTATGHVVYARTHNHSTMGVATGSTPVTTQFDVPSGIETGASTLVVIANGIPSVAVAVTIN